jgi:predicted transcriptional regulator
MSKVIVRTDDVNGFFSRAKQAARKADKRQSFEGSVTLSFEDPQRMFTVLSQERRRLMLEVMQEAKSISELSRLLDRNRSAITKDLSLLEKSGLIISHQAINPGHGIQKIVRAIAPRIEVVTTLGR